MSVPRLTYVELFAGAGGLSLGLEAAGFHPIAHCEIEPNARAVLRYRWPDVRLDGDVTQVNGADFKGVTLISGGSPCQDLSVAGKRKGLAGERSGLFHQQVRIWQESEAPYLLWENVLGALSSNNGRDFGTVLSTLVGATLPVPSDGWRGGGVAAGPDAVAAWRVLDLQHFGPPQRRVRVFVVAARTGGVDPAEVLALSESVCGHPSPREQSRQRAARGIGTGAPRGSGVGAFQNTGQGWWNQSDVAQTLRTPEGGDSMLANVLAFESTSGSGAGDAVLAFSSQLSAGGVGDGLSGTLTKSEKMGVLALDGTDTVGSLLARSDSSPCVDRGQPAVVQPLAFSRGGFGDWTQNEAVTALCARDGKDQSSIVLPSLTASLQNGATGHNKDELIIEQPQLVRKEWPKEIADTLTVAYAEKWGLEDQHINSGAGLFQPTHTGRPRRLTPLECERLMSWPDQWTATGIKEDGTEYALSDTARYRLCGNGVGSVCVAWFAQRLGDAIRKQHSPLTEGAA